MVLDRYRVSADRVLLPVAGRLRTVNPNTVSWLALAAAAGAGVSFFIGGAAFLILGIFLVFGNAGLDALDGKIAKISGRASARGDFLDHVLDRYSDVLMLSGVALGPYCPLWLGFVAILGVLLASYMGTQAQAVGVGRNYRGILGRADRLVILFVAGALQAALDPTGTSVLGAGALRLTYLGWAMALFALLGNVTAIQRAISTWRRLT